jgi:uncharacterized protein YdcH (DUF465 family)
MKRFDVRELEHRHHSLDTQIHELDRRGSHMSPEDRQRALELKKQRLATKDQLYAIRGRT